MNALREYKCWCHVCGAHYIHRAEFMSGGTVRVSEDGVNYQVRACDEHQGTGLIREAFLNYQKTGKSLVGPTAARETAIRKQMGMVRP